jgi:hypothetical protein
VRVGGGRSKSTDELTKKEDKKNHDTGRTESNNRESIEQAKQVTR